MLTSSFGKVVTMVVTAAAELVAESESLNTPRQVDAGRSDSLPASVWP